MLSVEIVNELIAQIVDDKLKKDEQIPIENVINALKVIDAKNFKTKKKVFVYFASLNLLNSYTKQPYALPCLKGNYYFKKYVGLAVDNLFESSKKVKIFCGEGNLLMVDCLGLEFSFHNVKVENNYASKNWSGIRLQPYANSIFELFYNKEFSKYNFTIQDEEIARLIQEVNNSSNK